MENRGMQVTLTAVLIPVLVLLLWCLSAQLLWREHDPDYGAQRQTQAETETESRAGEAAVQPILVFE